MADPVTDALATYADRSFGETSPDAVDRVTGFLHNPDTRQVRSEIQIHHLPHSKTARN